ncbi:MAG: lytic transglycosylase domain-containing protein [Thiobacillaceae bacterium]|nr:lytic transglycosylase domain-containing protein [Thiobacillaceae bacterium]
MSFLRRCCWWLCLACIALPAVAAVEKDFLAAREAYQKGRHERFEQHARKIPAEHVLQPYLKYWRLRASNRGPEARAQFIAQNPDTPLSDYFRAELARAAARAGDWPSFQSWSAGLARPDAEIRCYAHQAALARGEPLAPAAMLALYRDAADQPSSCEVLFDQLFEHGLLAPEDRYARLRLALDANNLRLAEVLDAALPEAERMAPGALQRAQKEPEQLVREGGEARAQREAALYALGRVARDDPEAAARLWETHQERYAVGEQRHGWALIATQAARRHDDRALVWYQRAGLQLGETQLLWKARASLRTGQWRDLLQTILAMPEPMRNEAVWRYWMGRAYKALNAPFAANQIFARLSREIHYYGLLADEELPVRLEARPSEQRAGEEDVRRVEQLPGIRRALLLRDMGLVADAVAEWDWALRGQDDPTLLAAAEIARRAQWYDRAIITAERTRELHDFDLRYLTPYRDLAQARARDNGLDEAWVYGLMRQESRFVAHARSRVGAQGLMQIMPDTARWIARQMGLKGKAYTEVQQPETNIRFGTFYLRRILDDLQGSPVLATAGYNAGPGRARRWQAPVPLEGAVYVESIPFAETREYVKKVMANAMYYSHRLGLQQTALKDRLGVVPPRQQASVAGEGVATSVAGEAAGG